MEIRVDNSFKVFSYKDEQRNQTESGGKSDKTRKRCLGGQGEIAACLSHADGNDPIEGRKLLTLGKNTAGVTS